MGNVFMGEGVQMPGFFVKVKSLYVAVHIQKNLQMCLRDRPQITTNDSDLLAMIQSCCRRLNDFYNKTNNSPIVGNNPTNSSLEEG